MISLLPPVHLAVVPRDRILTGLDELFTVLPHPADRTSSMVFISGSSRTTDIEQILVRGVHGPGEVHVVVDLVSQCDIYVVLPLVNSCSCLKRISL